MASVNWRRGLSCRHAAGGGPGGGVLPRGGGEAEEGRGGRRPVRHHLRRLVQRLGDEEGEVLRREHQVGVGRTAGGCVGQRVGVGRTAGGCG